MSSSTVMRNPCSAASKDFWRRHEIGQFELYQKAVVHFTLNQYIWNRLILDLNRASEAVGRSIAELREMVSSLKGIFLAFCT